MYLLLFTYLFKFCHKTFKCKAFVDIRRHLVFDWQQFLRMEKSYFPASFRDPHRCEMYPLTSRPVRYSFENKFIQISIKRGIRIQSNLFCIHVNWWWCVNNQPKVWRQRKCHVYCRVTGIKHCWCRTTCKILVGWFQFWKSKSILLM